MMMDRVEFGIWERFMLAFDYFRKSGIFMRKGLLWYFIPTGMNNLCIDLFLILATRVANEKTGDTNKRL